jgi:succinoglycan biosynthesis protein ExoA
MNHNEAIHVSVVVPCRNEIKYIGAFLDSLFRQELGGIQMDVLIADGMSIDGTRLVLSEYQTKFPSIRVLDNPEKIASAGLNRMIRQARGEIILRMDVHTTYAPSYVRSCVELLNETGAENVGGPALTDAEGYVAGAIAEAFHTAFASGGAKFRDPSYEGWARTVPYGCWRKSTLERIGLFDEELVRGQDDDLNFRIVSSGGKVWQSPRIVSWYHPRTDLSVLFRQFFQNGYWKVAVVRKYGRPLSWRNLAPGLTLLIGVVLPLCSAAASISGSTWWRSAFLDTWLSFAAMYLAASFASAFSVARRKGWKFFPFLPIVFATYQLSYALGFLLALFIPTAIWGLPGPMRKTTPAVTR